MKLVIWHTYSVRSSMKLDSVPNREMIACFEDENLKETNDVLSAEHPNSCAKKEVPEAEPELSIGTSRTYCPERSVSKEAVDPIGKFVHGAPESKSAIETYH